MASKKKIKRPALLGKVPEEKATTTKAAPAKKPTRTKTGPAAGTVIERTFKGQKIAVQATAGGYLYKGKAYKC